MTETWTQNYFPVGGSLVLSALAAVVPVGVLLGLLALARVRAHVAALWGLAAAVAIAVAVFGMPPRLALSAAGYGALYGLLPIGWIVVHAIFLYEIAVATGTFEHVKESIARCSDDARIQVLFTAFCFGAFIEGAAGFGTPVAISGAMLIGLGCKPLQAAVLALVGNTAPVAFGALGSPIIALAQVTGLDLHDLSAMVGRQLPFFSVIVPFWLIALQSGRRGLREVWPACLVTGVSFGLAQYAASNWHGPWLVDIVSALVSAASLLLLLCFWRPRTSIGFSKEETRRRESRLEGGPGPLLAWLPWIALTLLVFLWGLPAVKTWLNGWFAPRFAVPGLHLGVLRGPPLVPAPTPEPAWFVLNLLSATGTALLLAACVTAFALRVCPGRLWRLYRQTWWRIRLSLVTICAMLALAFTARYAGLDSTLGLAFASAGVLFPFFSALLGWLGVALTGSDTSSNVLFGNLQVVTAQQIGVSPILAAAANSSGGVMGKMIDAQSIVVAGVATRQDGEEGLILRRVFWHSIALAALVGVLVLLQAYVFPGVIP